MKYLIFRKGIILNQVITDNIIAAAKRGKITGAGKKIRLVPDKRYGTADSCGSRKFRSVKQNECISLAKLCHI